MKDRLVDCNPKRLAEIQAEASLAAVQEFVGRGEMSTKDLVYYMSLPYTIEFIPNDESKGFTTSIPALKGCISFGDSLQEAYEMITEAKQLWIETALEKGWDVPEPVT